MVVGRGRGRLHSIHGVRGRVRRSGLSPSRERPGQSGGEISQTIGGLMGERCKTLGRVGCVPGAKVGQPAREREVVQRTDIRRQ